MKTPVTHNPSTAPISDTIPVAQPAPATKVWLHRLATIAILGATVLYTHGGSLSDGLGLDDHWHYRTIRQSSWSLPELLDTTTIRSDALYEFWWQDHPVRFQYSRPLSVALMKTVYALTDGNVFAQHSVNLLLHWIAACLVAAICTQLTRSWFWSLVGGILFVVYPLSVNAVGWLAAQNMVLQTTLLLGAMLTYIRASNLNLDISATTLSLKTAGLDFRWFALTVALWIGALFSRENAIVLPAILVAMDVAFGGWRLAWRRRAAYITLAVIGIAFLVWRFGFYYEPMPEVYVRRSGDPGYILWCAAKLLHYVCGALWIVPTTVGPTGRIAPFTDVPFDMLLMFAGVSTVAIIYFSLAWKARGHWIWPLWIVLTMAPVIPVLATPHSGYICGVATSIALTLGPPSAKRRNSKRAYHISATLIFLALLSSIGILKVNRLMWKGLLCAESFVATSLRSSPLPPETTDVFFINLPFAAIYAKEHLVDANGLDYDALQCHVMTFAPQLPRMDQRSTITQLDEYRFSLRVESQPYFSRLLGRFLIDGFRKGGRFNVGDRVAGETFDVEILDASDEGVSELMFTFKKPLANPHYTFIVSSDECGAMRLNFALFGREDMPLPKMPPAPKSLDAIHAAAVELVHGKKAAADTFFAGIDSPMTAIQLAAATQLTNIVKPIAIATASEIVDVFDDSKITKQEATRLRKWWHTSVEQPMIDQVFKRRNELQEIRHKRDELRRGRALIRRYIKSDLYLTGEPFPGP